MGGEVIGTELPSAAGGTVAGVLELPVPPMFNSWENLFIIGQRGEVSANNIAELMKKKEGRGDEIKNLQSASSSGVRDWRSGAGLFTPARISPADQSWALLNSFTFNRAPELTRRSSSAASRGKGIGSDTWVSSLQVKEGKPVFFT